MDSLLNRGVGLEPRQSTGGVRYLVLGEAHLKGCAGRDAGCGPQRHCGRRLIWCLKRRLALGKTIRDKDSNLLRQYLQPRQKEKTYSVY